MTTLAYRAGVLAADSRSTRGDYVSVDVTKVHKLGDGRLVGSTGGMGEAMKFINALQEGNITPPELENSTVVVISLNGTIRIHEAAGAFDAEPCEFAAWGSGMAAALAAMHANASAEEAVRIATLIDTCSGGPVRSVRLGA